MDRPLLVHEHTSWLVVPLMKTSARGGRMLDKTRDTFNPVIRPPRVSNIVVYSPLPGNWKLEEGREQREILIYFLFPPIFLIIPPSFYLYRVLYISKREEKKKIRRILFPLFRRGSGGNTRGSDKKVVSPRKIMSRPINLQLPRVIIFGRKWNLFFASIYSFFPSIISV